MPRRNDISSICLIGSGPIVIGQACEFDYAGCQALKVLREEGYRTIVVNSNPATIMTDPGFADATYLEPLDLEGVAAVLRRERPDALLPTMGGQTALNLALELHEAGILAELGIELIGAGVDAIARAEDRQLFKDAVESCGLEMAKSTIVTDVAQVEGPADAGGRPAGLHPRRPRRRLRGQPRRAPATGRTRPCRIADSPGARRGIASRLGRVRAGGRPGPRRQRRDRLLDREPRSDGRPHRRLGHGRAPDDAPRRGLPGAPRRGDRGHPRRRCRHRRLEHPVRPGTAHRRAARDRDEPARLALLGARVEGDRLPDRQGRGPPCGRLHARRDPERPHRHDPRKLRADARLRRRQDAALRLREVPGRRPDARHSDEVGRRVDGHRPHVRRGIREGPARPRDRSRVAAPRAPSLVRARARARGLRPGRPRSAASTRAPERSRRPRTTSTRPAASATSSRPSPAARS